MAESRSGDRVPPHDVEAEAALLGAMLLDRDVVTELGDAIAAEYFYVTAHRLVFEAIVGLEAGGSAIDAVTLKDELRRRKTFEQIGGGETLVRLMESVPSSAGFRHHARIVRDNARLRALMQAAQGILGDCYEYAGQVDDLVDQAEQRIFQVGAEKKGEASSVHDLIRGIFETIQARQTREPGSLTGVDTGFIDVNELTDGLHRGNLVIVAARPSMGKTSFALNIGAQAALRTKTPVLIFSLEVPKEQVVENILCSTAMVNAHKMRRGGLESGDWDKLTDAANELSKAAIFVDDTPGISALGLRAKARRAAAKHKIGLIIVDYLQLMTYPGAESRQHEITMISQALKTTARELDVPVVALSQLNRAVDAREDHRPRMSDLRESGSIEQDADLIMFLYREAYYKEVAAENEREAEVIVAKHRNGPTGDIKLYFLGEYLRFVDPVRYRPT